MNIGKDKRILGIAGLVVIVAIAGAVYFFYSPLRKTMSPRKTQDARDLYNRGDFTSAVDALAKAALDEKNSGGSGGGQLLYATTLVARAQGDDVAKGIQIYKQLINNYKITPWVRGLALKDMAIVVLHHDAAFYKQQFSDDPFNGYLPSGGSDADRVKAAYAKILESSDEVYPNSSAEYGLAGYHAALIQNGLVSSADLQSTAEKMQQYVKDGDSRSDLALYSPSGVIGDQTNRARAVWVSGSILKNTTTKDQEAAFVQAMNLSNEYLSDPNNKNNEFLLGADLALRFYYAAFLFDSFGKERAPDIVTLLKTFGNVSEGVRTTLGGLGSPLSLSNASYVKKEALQLSKISGEYNAFLEASNK